MTRREFIGGVLAFGMGGSTSVSAVDGTEPVPPKPNLRFGVMSDIHIGGKKDAAATAEKVLRYFASEHVDAVLCPGDIAHSGLIGELEAFAAVWRKVFPENGRRVALMISTGNHDVDAWGGRWKRFTEEQMDAQRFSWKDNPQKTWRRLFGQDWSLIWRREVKGYTFVGAPGRALPVRVLPARADRQGEPGLRLHGRGVCRWPARACRAPAHRRRVRLSGRMRRPAGRMSVLGE